MTRSGVRGARRRWSEDEKARIVAECAVPGASVSLVARRHDLNTNLLFSWLRRIRDQSAGAGDGTFVPAIIEPEQSSPSANRSQEVTVPSRSDTPSDTAARSPGRIEIVLGRSRRVIVDEGVSATALARVISVLERR
jgi:transposase